MKLKVLLRYFLTIFLIISCFGSEIFAASIQKAGDDTSDASIVLCNVYKFTSGKVGKGIFILIICFTAGSFFLGKANVSVMIVIAIAGGVFFAAPKITQLITGDTTAVCTT